jgi:hypothetical protein
MRRIVVTALNSKFKQGLRLRFRLSDALTPGSFAKGFAIFSQTALPHAAA